MVTALYRILINVLCRSQQSRSRQHRWDEPRARTKHWQSLLHRRAGLLHRILTSWLVFYLDPFRCRRPYYNAEIPANLIVRKVSPRIFIPAISVIWGCITLAEGFVKNWKSLVGLRVLLGILEAGMYRRFVGFLLLILSTRFPSCGYFAHLHLVHTQGGADTSGSILRDVGPIQVEFEFSALTVRSLC